MANDYEELDWTCSKCTFFNTQSNKKCSMCDHENDTIKNNLKNTTNKMNRLHLNPAAKTNGKHQPQQILDSNNNNSDAKYTGILKAAINNISNDVKHFFNGFGPTNNNKNDYNDNMDVIEIDPKTNKPIRTIKSKDKKELNKSYQQWTCSACTFAANPEWNTTCEICSAKRQPSNNGLQPNEKIKHNDEADASVTIYDSSLNEEIYEYARIWTCKQCTFINFDKDKECELCLTPRNLPQQDSPGIKILNSDETNKNKGNPAKTSKNDTLNKKVDRWVCKICTYLNSNKTERCSLCNGSKDPSKDKNHEWPCPICSHKNHSTAQICIKCSNDRNYEPMDYQTNEDSSQNHNQYDNNKKPDQDEEEDDDIDDSYFPRNSLNHSRASTLNPSLTYRSQKAKSAIKTYTTATSQAERVWNNIIKYCNHHKEKFVDDSFPPCDKSLFIDPSVKPANLETKGIQWLSPEQIRTHHDEHNLKWSVYNDPKFNDIKQGLLGNCWLLSGLAVIIEQPELLRKIIMTKDFCPQGCYQVRLCHNGEWQTVILDDLFPCDSNGSLIYSQATKKQLWVPLIEKAVAKLNGSYESLIAGQTIEGLSTLTGYPCDSVRLETNSSDNEDAIDLEIIWARLLSMKEFGYALGASCGRTDIKDDNVFTSKGLLPRHAYSVLNVKEVFGNQLIQLRNPWGRYTWTGDWSENSNNWTPEIRKALGLKPKKVKNGSNQQTSSSQNDNHLYNNTIYRSNDQGVFWMSFNDFVKYFCSIDICKTRLNWFENRMTGYFNSEGTREMQAYHLVVFETSELDIGLFHKTIKNRRENSDLDLCFVVLRTNGEKNSVGKLVVSSKHSVKKFIGCEHIFEPGEYIIVPFSFNFWYTGLNSIQNAKASTSSEEKNTSNNLYNLVIHSTKTFFLEQDMHSAFLLADTLIQLCLSKGSKTYAGLENACIYTLTKGFAGIVVVAENLNQRTYLHVELDCERSNNVVSTRQVLTTKDSVQPLHRQVLIVLSHLEGSSGYSIQYSIKYRLSSNPYLNTWPGIEGQMATNIPDITKQTFGLHAPRSAFF